VDDRRGASRVLVGKPEGKRLFGITGEDGGLTELSSEGVNWILLRTGTCYGLLRTMS
jgi:hypothetical protein